MKTNKNYWLTVSKDLNEWVEKDRYERLLKIEHTGFFPLHRADRGLNHNESNTLNFATKLIEAKEVLFIKGSEKQRSTLFIKSTVENYTKRGVYLELRYNNTTFCFQLNENRCYIPYEFGRKLPAIKEVFSEEYSWFCKQVKTEARPLRIEDGKRVEIQEYEIDKRFNKEILGRFTNYQKDTENNFKACGIKVLRVFEYTESYSLYGSFDLKKTRHGMELVWYSLGTYNSLPNRIRVTKATNLNTVKLVDLGAELRGYYSHDRKATVLRDQAAAVKKFMAALSKKTA